jgi:hypothetical protein
VPTLKNIERSQINIASQTPEKKKNNLNPNLNLEEER